MGSKILVVRAPSLIILTDFSRKTKIKIYNTLLRPFVTYRRDTWTLTKKKQEIVRGFERKIVRRVYDPVGEDGE